MTSPLSSIQPLFVCLGVPKAATTWIHRQLEAHPEVSVTTSKEINYWTVNYQRGPGWYVAEFPQRNDAKVHAEVSVSYFGERTALARMAGDLEDVRFMVSLRNPYERALSHYWQMIRAGTFAGTLTEAIDINPKIVESSLYVPRLQAYLEFFPMNQLHVALYDDLQADPLTYVRTLYGFLGVNQEFVPSELGSRVNVGRRESPLDAALFRAQQLAKRWGLKRAHLMRLGLWRPLERTYAWLGRHKPLPPARQEQLLTLDRHLRADVLELQALLGRDLSRWLPRAG
jgi:hypothetical protein